MYYVFTSIPKPVRRQAFQELAKRGYGIRHGSGMVACSVEYDGQLTCPLGMVNRFLPGMNKEVVTGHYFDGTPKSVSVHIPQDGEAEQLMLATVGISIASDDAQRFINDNDSEKFVTLNMLARAMGVEYQPEGE